MSGARFPFLMLEIAVELSASMPVYRFEVVLSQPKRLSKTVLAHVYKADMAASRAWLLGREHELLACSARDFVRMLREGRMLLEGMRKHEGMLLREGRMLREGMRQHEVVLLREGMLREGMRQGMLLREGMLLCEGTTLHQGMMLRDVAMLREDAATRGDVAA